MSGNAHQRKVTRHHRELLELGRRAKTEIDTHAAAAAGVRATHVAELASLRAGHEQEITELRGRHEAELASWASASRADTDLIASLRAKLQSTEELAVGLQLRLDHIEEEGLVTKREHEAAVVAETARLRDRLRRATEERLAPKKILIDHTQEERRLREALGRQRENFRAIADAGDAAAPDALLRAARQGIAEVDGALGERA